MPRRLGRKLLFSLLLGLVVVAALSLYADLPKMLAAFGRFDWKLLPLILGLATYNYALRFAKWHYYLAQIGVRGVKLWDSLLIFLSAFPMGMTPGKLGEWLKSFLLREMVGTPISASAPIVMAERLTDGLAMLVLALGGLLLYGGYAWQAMAVIVAPAVVVIIASQHRPLALRLLSLGERLPAVSPRIHHLHAFYESSNQLFRMRSLLVAIGLGVISWAGECVALYLVLVGLGLEGSPLLLLQATFIMSASSIVGAASLLPGGLAATEGSIAGMLLFLGITTEPALAAAATLLIRFCTLWYGVGIGLVALSTFSRRTPGIGVLPPDRGSARGLWC